jgi:pescadillo protein
MATKCLKKVFVSIKGIYYQAEIRGQDITWVAPHAFSQDTPSDVDFRIMSTFLELYVNLVSFINYKLYKDMNLAYPPKVDPARDAEAGGLSAFMIETADGKELLDSIASSNTNKSTSKQKKYTERRLKTLTDKLSTLADQEEDAAMMDVEDEDEDAAAQDGDISSVPVLAAETSDPSETLPTLQDAAPDSASSPKANLFKDLVFYLSREVPRHSLEFIIRACGGQVGWDPTCGGGSTIKEDDPRITHHIVDRPQPNSKATSMGRRELLQPQWVFDCVNHGKLVKTKGYHVGETLPPHLSPFGGTREGYVPLEEMEVDGEEDTNVVEKAEEEVEKVDVEEEEDSEGVTAVEDNEEEDEEDDEDDEDDEEEEEDVSLFSLACCCVRCFSNYHQFCYCLYSFFLAG